MKPTYILGLDLAKHKVRAALREAAAARFLFEKDLPASATGLRELLARLKEHMPLPERLLVVLEATGVLHLNWSAAFTQAGYAVAVVNPLMARRLCPLENSIRQNKTDPIDARGLCELGARHGEKLLTHYRFALAPTQFALQRLQTVRKALRTSLTNLKKTYQSVLDLSFPELGRLMELDGVGLRALLAQAPTPQAIARKRRSTLEQDWKLRPKAAALQALAKDSIADPELSAASAPALQMILQALAEMEARLRTLDQEIDTLSAQSVDPQTKSLLQTLPRLRSHHRGQSPGLPASRHPACWEPSPSLRPAPGLHGERAQTQGKRAVERPNQDEQARSRDLAHRLLPGGLQCGPAGPGVKGLLPAQARPR